MKPNLVACLVTSLLGLSARAAVLPTGFVETSLTTALSSATAMAIAPDGRIFVCQQGGALRVIKNGALLSQPFVTITVNSAGERGLLGVAFDPNFAANRFVYVYYTATTPSIHNRVSRFTANGDVAVAGSELVLLDLDNLSSATNHNGGALHFGPDGKLYIAVGENANTTNAQSFSNLLGKILRINSDGTIPTDNPFLAQTTGKNRAIWALGLRNPFTFTFQNGTGRMFINDVGAGTWEEINDGRRGANYGWPTTEGETTDPRFVSPLFVYGHGSGPTVGCAITGGAFYNPSTMRFPSSYANKYFFADYCSGWIRTYDSANDTAAAFATGAGAVVDLAVSNNGKLYYLNRTSVYEIDSTTSQAPQITAHPQSQTRSVGQPVTFSLTASGAAPLSYQWQRNNIAISGATSSTYTIPAVSAADNGSQFRAVVTNAAGSATSNAATLTVIANQLPSGAITSPNAGALYSGGQTITFAGSGLDAEDGALPASAFTWTINFHHDTHTHPAMQATSGITSGVYTIPDSGETSANVFYRVYLTVRDSAGQTSTTFRDVQPRKATLTLDSLPAGAQLTLDGQPVRAPVSVVGVVGIKRVLGAPSPQTIGQTQYSFSSWSDGGAQTHQITTPAANTTYTARFGLGLIGSWNFDEGLGTVAHDTSGRGYNATVSGAAWTTGKVNSGLRFNGGSASVITPNIPLGRAFSISAWVNPATLTQGAYARIAETRFDSGFYLGTDASGTKYKFIVNGGLGATGSCGAAFGCVESGSIASGWHLITGTFDGTTARLYVDSALVASDTFTAPPNTNLTLYIGRYYASSGYGWAGSIDEVHLYDRALEAGEPQPSPTVTGYWNFDEGVGSAARDSSGNAYNATVTGATWVAGKVNSALRFNGATSSVTTPNIPFGAAFSISAWVNPLVTSQGAFARIAETRFNSGFYLGTDASGRKYKFIVNNGSGSSAACGAVFGCVEGGSITAGWHLVTGTFDGSTARLYVDNTLVASDTFSAPANTSLPLYVGRYYGGTGYGWSGSIDEVRLFDRALTAAEVSALFGQ